MDKKKKKKIAFYSVLDPGKVQVCLKKEETYTITIKLNTMQSL